MTRLLVLILLLWLSGPSWACESKQLEASVDDVVFNNITPESAEFDQQLQAMYGCKYPFAMLFSSNAYESMRMINGSMPETPTDSSGTPITGQVLIGFVLTADGVPSDPVVLKSADERLSKVALGHVVGLKYRPSKFKGRVVRALGIQVYGFE